MPHKRSTLPLAPDLRALANLLPLMLDKYADRVPDDRGHGHGVWSMAQTRYGCPFSIAPIIEIGRHPWLACRFLREYDPLRDWQGQVLYRDIADRIPNVNRFSGKHNCHIWDRFPAEDMVYEFERHIRSVLPGDSWLSRSEWFDHPSFHKGKKAKAIGE